MYLGASKHMFTHTSSWKKQIKNLPNLPTKDRQTCVQPGSAGRTEVTTALERLKLSTQNKTDRNKGFEKFQVSNVNKVVVFYLPSIRLGTWKKKTNTWDWKMLGKPSSWCLLWCGRSQFLVTLRLVVESWWFLGAGGSMSSLSWQISGVEPRPANYQPFKLQTSQYKQCFR